MAINRKKLIQQLESDIQTNARVAELFGKIDQKIVRISNTKISQINFLLHDINSGKFDTGIMGIIRRYKARKAEAKFIEEMEANVHEQEDN